MTTFLGGGKKQLEDRRRLEERLRVDPILREFYPKLLAIPLKPKPGTYIHAELDDALVELVTANPESVEVRITIRRPDNVTVVYKPRRAQMVEVKA
jgi:hypothetical protein